MHISDLSVVNLFIFKLKIKSCLGVHTLQVPTTIIKYRLPEQYDFHRTCGYLLTDFPSVLPLTTYWLFFSYLMKLTFKFYHFCNDNTSKLY